MKNSVFLFLIFMLFSVLNIQAQDLESVDTSIDDTKKKKSRLTKQFAKIATGNSFSSIGNFASIATTDKTLSASLFFLTESENVINLEVSGGATQEIASIFDEGKLNAKASVGVSYNLMLRKANNAIATNSTTEDGIRLEIENANRKYQKKMLALLSDGYKTDIDKDIAIANQTKTALTTEKQKTENLILNLKKQLSDNDKIEETINQKDALQSQIDEVDNLISNLATRRGLVDRKKYNELVNVYESQRDSKIDELSNKIIDLKPDAISFSWISVGYKATNSSFTLFDESLTIDKQIISDDYTTQSFFLSYNHHSNARAIIRGNEGITSFKSKKREYFSLGIKFDYTDNLASLKQVEVVNTTVIDATSGRTKVEKQNAFTGDYEDELSNLTAFIDYYNFISNEDILALHFNPVMQFRENFKPVASFQFGVVLPFKDKAKQTTTVNLEIFYKVKDIFNTTDNKNSLLNRNTIGIQASFPFNF